MTHNQKKIKSIKYGTVIVYMIEEHRMSLCAQYVQEVIGIYNIMKREMKDFQKDTNRIS